MLDNILLETNEYRLKSHLINDVSPAVLYISSDHFGESGKCIADELTKKVENRFSFYELVVKDWDCYLTPWEAESNIKGRHFEGQAGKLLESIMTNILPKIKEYTDYTKLYIAGYSLAGLFSLWSIYESDIFDGAVCCSGSLWYQGWAEYVQSSFVNKLSDIYLSLGKAEKNTKHPLMKYIEDNMKLQYELLSEDEQVDKIILEWNEGGHFSNTNERIIKGIEWILQ